MATKQLMQYCPYCERNSAHLQQKPSHLLHLFLSIITVGVWLVVWLLLALFAGKPVCTVCGGNKKAALAARHQPGTAAPGTYENPAHVIPRKYSRWVIIILVGMFVVPMMTMIFVGFLSQFT